MEERLAMLVSGFSELEEKLSRFLQEPQEGGDWYRGQVKQHKETLSLFRADEELQEAIDKWLKRGKYEKLLQGWVKGLTIDWKQLYREQFPRRISLPTYPFAQQYCWIPTPKVEPIGSLTATSGGFGKRLLQGSHLQATTSLAALHPLVQRNNSTL